VMATANHFWLDVVGGIAVALLALVLLQSRRFLRLFPRLA
jgi:membrane-associated phospholipid phosphatase